MISRILKYAWWGLVVICFVSFFNRNNLRSVDILAPEVFIQPEQVELSDPSVISFYANYLSYRLTPLYTYSISGIVVGKMDYQIFSSLDKYDKVFPVDLCLIWGVNAKRKVYLEEGVNFSQDCRWCWAEWRGSVAVDLHEMSNNHLLVNDPKIFKIINSIGRGDQVTIRGKLVDVKAKDLGHPEAPEITWKTSITRSDSGAGACEVIYVEDITILRPANMIFRLLFRWSFPLLLLLTIVMLVRFFILPAKY